MTDQELMQQALKALEKLRDGLLKMREHAESYGHSWAMAYVKEYREMLPGAAVQQFRALNVLENRLADVAEGVNQGFDAITALRGRLSQPEKVRNFCPRCGKRTNDIHTCTPPMEKT